VVLLYDQRRPLLGVGQLAKPRRPLDAREALAMIKRRAKAADLGDELCCHTFRATGMTNYLENGGTLEKAQQIAAHSSPRTTKLYDRTSDQVDLGEIEKIQI
jgi:integrase